MAHYKDHSSNDLIYEASLTHECFLMLEPESLALRGLQDGCHPVRLLNQPLIASSLLLNDEALIERYSHQQISNRKVESN